MDLHVEFKGDGYLPRKKDRTERYLTIAMLACLVTIVLFVRILWKGDDDEFDSLGVPGCEANWSYSVGPRNPYESYVVLKVEYATFKISKSGTAWMNDLMMAAGSSHAREVYECVVDRKKAEVLRSKALSTP